MGTRLYPMTNDERKLERLANVAPGTAKLARMKDSLFELFKQQQEDQNSNDQDIEYDWHCLFSGSDVDRYQSFLLFGWGKFDLDYVPKDQERYCGSTTDLDAMLGMLTSSGWDQLPYEPGQPSLEQVLQISEGFHWG